MTPIYLKEGVDLSTARPETLEAIQICAIICADYRQRLIVTSITDGNHSAKSLHRFGLAFDFRTRDWSADTKDYLIKTMQTSLGHSYDVVDEPDHGHVEFDP
jgi:hypothetical protein